MSSKDSLDESTSTPKKFGRYDILELLATGGMARVYKASTKENRIFTIKKILPEYSRADEFIQMFLEEAKISLSLKHPHITRVLDFGQIDGSYYLAMEYVFGRDLGSLLKRSLEKRVHIPVDVACQIIIQCCRGMDYAHRLTDAFGTSLGIIHRDISPPNILVSYNGEAKILDFGIAKAIRAAENRNTRSGVLKGKFSYMSPEQTRGEYLTAQSDLFSLGIVLHELLTSRSLFYTKDEIETLERVRKADVPKPSSLRKGLSEEIDSIVLKALQPKIKKRYDSCAEFADRLENFLSKHYPRSDNRTTAKFVRLLFEDDFEKRFPVARKEGWKDVLISGGDDEELLLDRYRDSEPSRTDTRGLQVGWIQRIFYDPKISQKIAFGAKTLGFIAGGFCIGLLFWKSEFGRGVIESWKAGVENVESPPSPYSQIAAPVTVERGTFAWWRQEAETAIELNQIETAIDYLDRALKINPYEKDLFVKRQYLLLKLGDESSCDWFEQQKDLSPADSSLWRGICLELAGDILRATNHYSDFVKKFPEDPRQLVVKKTLEHLLKNQVP